MKLFRIIARHRTIIFLHTIVVFTSIATPRVHSTEAKQPEGITRHLQALESWIEKESPQYATYGIVGSLILAYKIFFPKHVPLFIKKKLNVGRKIRNEKIINDVRKICKKMGMKKGNDIDLYMAHNTIAATYGHNIFCNPRLPEAFTRNEQRFILGHEISHIKNHHQIKVILAALGIPIGIDIGIPLLNTLIDLFVDAAAAQCLKNNHPTVSQNLEMFKTWHKKISSHSVTKLALFIALLLTYIQSLEKEADMQAATILDAAYDGIEVFKKILAMQNGKEPWDLLHPSLTRRIAYLSKIEQKKKCHATRKKFFARPLKKSYQSP